MFSGGTLFVLIFALSRKKIHLRAKISTEFTLKKAMRENYFFVKNKGKKDFQNQRFLCNLYITMYRRSHCFASSTKKQKTRRIQKQCYSQFFLYFFLWTKITSEKDYSNLKLQHCHLHFLWELYVYLQHF